MAAKIQEGQNQRYNIILAKQSKDNHPDLRREHSYTAFPGLNYRLIAPSQQKPRPMSCNSTKTYHDL